MTCFMPGLPPNTQFNISLHCWKTPHISQFTRNYSKHPELVKFEARVLLDGRLVASSSFDRSGPWPQLINHSFEFTKNGDLETLRFPPFRNEVLRQSYWSPADELGRIKIIISEGFPRDSLSVPIERVKNIVAFSFQHAPLDILESSGIAWPNPGMWRRGPFNPTMPVPAQQHEDGPDAHLHSPRRRSSYMRGTSRSSGSTGGPSGFSQANTNNLLGSMPNTQALLQRGGTGSSSAWADAFGTQKSDSTACFDWTNNFGPVGYSQVDESMKSNWHTAPHRRATGTSKMSQSDASMADYGLSNSSNAPGICDHQFLNLSTSSLADADNSVNDPKAPTNTPTTLVGPDFIDDLGIDLDKAGHPGNDSMNDFFNSNNINFSSELATSLTHSLLNQPHPLAVQGGGVAPPAPEVKSRKENRLNQDCANEDMSATDHVEMRKVSQATLGNIVKDTQDASSNNSPPSQSAFSGIFSRRSASAGDFSNDLANVTNVFTHPNVDSHEGGDTTPDARVAIGSEKGFKRVRHFTPVSGRAMNDNGETLSHSPRMHVELNDHNSFCALNIHRIIGLIEREEKVFGIPFKD
ncbi:hypothetical protein GGR54DRAFT_604308 [Hypoxylon sp. NC1633]|nr:hypothetical protein GGR54DRAFT_604308 [Hypoxylon sp. NC1633]